ncbi:hypothetical protein MUK42_37275 [Musa troglodytarum]|uniref:Uncharacterized protein n=1 Tax=Musa troglodytarum TaxID=320322 RepID=A0A9E7EB72_9LILI|nr:hypothetical protein MUK42_37275 [Musa troglodytarum]
MIEEFDAYGAHVSNCLGLHTPHVGTKQPLGSVHWILLSLSLLHHLVPCWRKTRRLHMAPVVTGGLSLSSLFLTHPCNLGLLHLSAFYPPMYLDSFPNNSCPGFTSRCSSCRCSFLPPSRIAFLGPKRLQVPCVNAFLIREEWNVLSINCFRTPALMQRMAASELPGGYFSDFILGCSLSMSENLGRGLLREVVYGRSLGEFTWVMCTGRFNSFMGRRGSQAWAKHKQYVDREDLILRSRPYMVNCKHDS